MAFIIIRLFLIFGILILISYFLLFVVVPQNHVFIQERFGTFHKVLKAGFHFQIPFVDSISYKLVQKEQSQSIEKFSCLSGDSIPFLINSVCIFQILDPVKAAYETENFYESLLLETQSQIRAEVHNHHSEEILARRFGMNQSIVKYIGESAENWGIKIIRFEIQEMKRLSKIT